MLLHNYIFFVRFFVVISFTLFGGVIFFFSPERGGFLAYGVFYLLFFVISAGLSMLSLMWLWRRLAHTKITSEDLAVVQRQGILVGILMTTLLGLQHMRMLFWWDAIIVTAAILLVELFFTTRESVR